MVKKSRIDRSIDRIAFRSFSLFTHSPFEYLSTLQAPPSAPHLCHMIYYLIFDHFFFFSFLFSFSFFPSQIRRFGVHLRASMFKPRLKFHVARIFLFEVSIIFIESWRMVVVTRGEAVKNDRISRTMKDRNK